MKPRRPKKHKGTPKRSRQKKPPLKKRRLSRSKRNIARRARYLLVKQSNVEVLVKGRRRKTVARFDGPRDQTLNQVKDFLADIQPRGKTFILVSSRKGENIIGTKVGDWQQTYFEIDARALNYLKNKADTAYDESIKVELVILGG